MTASNCRTNCRKPTQMRKFATLPLKREPLTQCDKGAALDRRVSVAAATVTGASLSYAPEPSLGRSRSRLAAAGRTLGMVSASVVALAVAAFAWPIIVSCVSNRMGVNRG